MKIKENDFMPNFSYLDIDGNSQQFSSLLRGDSIALVFLRYHGCTICLLAMQEYEEKIALLEKQNIQLAVVLESNPKTVREELGEHRYPFPLLLDPEGAVYEQLSIPVAKNKLGLADFATVKKMRLAKKKGLEHGAYEGTELRLPATFLLHGDGKVHYAHYGTSAADTPDAEEIIKLFQR